MKKTIINYFKATLTYGAMRGIFYNYDRNDICLNDKFSTIVATSLITPLGFFNSIYQDVDNIRRFSNGEKIIRKQWIEYY